MSSTALRGLLAGLALSALLAHTASASFVYYSQNFDDKIATTTTVSAYFSATAGVQSPIPPGGSGSSGWVGAKIAGSGTGNMNFNVDNGNNNQGALYSYGSTASGSTTPDLERALGSLASGTNTGAFGVEIVNTTNLTFPRATIMYTGEYWRSSTSSAVPPAPNKLDFAYSIGAPGSTTFLTGPATDFDALDLVGPPPVALNGPLDGDLPANQVPMMATITGISWAPGQSLYVRFQDFNDLGNDAGLAVDDFKVIIPEPSSALLALLASLACAGFGRRPGR
jgi:hypothetical protein